MLSNQLHGKVLTSCGCSCCRYGHDDVAKKLEGLCPVDVSKSAKLQDAEWVGKVLKAARSGDGKAMKELLKHEKTTARLRKLRKAVEVR